MATSEDILKNPFLRNLVQGLEEVGRVVDDPTEYLIPKSGAYPEDQIFHPFEEQLRTGNVAGAYKNLPIPVTGPTDPGLAEHRKLLQQTEGPANTAMNVSVAGWGLKKLLRTQKMQDLIQLIRKRFKTKGKKSTVPPTKTTTKDVRDALAEHKQLRQKMNEVPSDIPDIVPLHDYKKIAEIEALEKSAKQYRNKQFSKALNKRGNAPRESFISRRLAELEDEQHLKNMKRLDDLLRDD